MPDAAHRQSPRRVIGVARMFARPVENCLHATALPPTRGNQPNVQACAMSVYVDDAVMPWRGQHWAHLMADTLEELHSMAARLGIPRRALQDKRSGVHYDVTVEMREQALQLGAIAISRHVDREQVRAVIRNARAQATAAK